MTECERAAFVLDASALLAYLRGDQGGAVVRRVLQQCRDCETRATIAASALLETFAVAAREAPAVFEDLVALVDQLPLDARPVTVETVRAAVDLVAANPGFSADQATALVLTSDTATTLVTGDLALAGRDSVLYVGPREGEHEP